MYPKILVPLDGSNQAEKAIHMLRNELALDSIIILLQVIPPAKAQRIGEHTILASQQEESDRAAALAYLKSVASQQSAEPAEWRFEVAVSNLVADEIANVALREKVDLVAMYTHNRRGIACLIRGSVTEAVRDKVSIEVRSFSSDELQAVAP